MSEKYYIMPGCAIGKDGLPGKKLECGKSAKPKLIEEKHVKVIEKNLGFYISQGTIKTGSDLEKDAEKEKAAEESKKNQAAGKLKALVDEAEKMGIEIPAKPTQKALKELIEAKKGVSALDALKKEAADLEIEIPENATASSLAVLIDAKKKELEE